MSENNTSKKLFIVTMIIINVVLLFLLFTLKKYYSQDSQQKEATLETLIYRTIESSRINSDLTGRSLINFSGALTGEGNIIDSAFISDFRSSFILVISGNTCSTCIPESFAICSELFGPKSVENFYVLGDYSTPTGMFQLMEQKGINKMRGIYSMPLARHFAGAEEIPILIKIGDNLTVERACFVDKHMPGGFYRNFLRQPLPVQK